MSFEIINADVFEGLQRVPDGSIHCVITSPPYLGLRKYSGVASRQWADGTSSVLGEEDTVDRYVTHLVEVFRELKRVLHPRGTFWLNLGDSHAGGGRHAEPIKYAAVDELKPERKRQRGMHGKSLLMVPARAALALQDDGWLLRSDVIWAKGCSFLPSFAGAVMPESTKDRPIHAHEHLFLFALRPDYFYDIDGCREPYADSTIRDAMRGYKGQGTKDYASSRAQNPSDTKRRVLNAVSNGTGRNLRDVWIISKENYPGIHFATFSTKLVEPVIKLATSEKGCCPECGAQVQRKTVREPVPQAVQEAFERARAASMETSGRTDGHTRRRPNYRRRVLATEWERGCEHEFDIQSGAVPSRVLDPFCGSGRAGIVTVRLGRDFTGIDASAGYCRMASEAIERELRRASAGSASDAQHATGAHHSADRQPNDVAGRRGSRVQRVATAG